MASCTANVGGLTQPAATVELRGSDSLHPFARLLVSVEVTASHWASGFGGKFGERQTMAAQSSK